MGTISRGELPIVSGQKGSGGGGGGNDGGEGGNGSQGPNKDPWNRKARAWQTVMQFQPAFNAMASAEHAARQKADREQLSKQVDSDGRRPNFQELVTYKKKDDDSFVFLQVDRLQHILDPREGSPLKSNGKQLGRLEQLSIYAGINDPRKMISEIMDISSNEGTRHYPGSKKGVGVITADNGFIVTAMPWSKGSV